LKRGSNIIEFGKLLNEKAKAQVDVQTHWCKVKSVDWDKKTMTATGIIDDLDFFDVLLGLGSINRKPSLQSKCLIGIVNNNTAAAFLIECEEIEEIEISDKTGFKLVLNNGNLTINGDKFGGIVDAIELKKQVDKNTAVLEAIQTAFQSWVTVPNDGGAALKGIASSFINLAVADLSNIQNEKIKHG
jgi:hypothetical protein